MIRRWLQVCHQGGGGSTVTPGKSSPPLWILPLTFISFKLDNPKYSYYFNYFKLTGSGPQERYQILRQNSDPDLIKEFPYPMIKIVEKGPNICI